MNTQNMLALFRQIHVLEGGVETFNKALLSIPEDEIFSLREKPSGEKLFQHFKSLQSGEVKKNQIVKKFLPFEELLPQKGVIDKEISLKKNPVNSVEKKEKNSILEELMAFSPDEAHLNRFQKDFGDSWKKQLEKVVQKENSKEIHIQYDVVLDFSDALDAWHLGETILAEDNQVKARAQIKNIESFLQKFGDAGEEMIRKIKTLALLG
ncbi:MAG: hypothetical protein ACTSXV_01430 [Alphaproteobacteria bacterium]